MHRPYFISPNKNKYIFLFVVQNENDQKKLWFTGILEPRGVRLYSLPFFLLFCPVKVSLNKHNNRSHGSANHNQGPELVFISRTLHLVPSAECYEWITLNTKIPETYIVIYFSTAA